jgi:small subunit ribosomal protein S21
MINIEVKDGNIAGALKRLKKKFDSIGVVKELRDRQQFTKPSVTKREMMEKFRITKVKV